MSRGEAEARATELNRKHPDRATYRWLAQETPDGWRVARVRLPAGVRVDPLKASVESKPRPSEPPDPRPSHWRNVGGPYLGG